LCSPNIIQVIQSRIMKGAGHVARMEEIICAYRLFVGNLRERDQMEDIDLDGRKILKYIFKKWDGGAWTGLIWIRVRTDDESSIEPSSCIKCGEFLD